VWQIFLQEIGCAVMAAVSPGEASKERYEIAVVARALDVLAELGRDGSVTTARAAALTNTSGATAYRLLVTLQSRGFVELDRANHHWTLGSAFFDVAERSTQLRLSSVAMPHLLSVRDSEMETVNLAIYANNELVYVEVIESPHRFRMSGERGERAPLHATALGRAVLAALPNDERIRILDTLVTPAFTDRTMTRVDDLLRELEITATRGWAEEHGETELGVTCYGAAVLNAGGRPIAAVSISAPDARINGERERRLGRAIRELAEQISQSLAERE
jgi:IclR family acetate operon transcriptional repressor